ncbi:3-ketodihydrosphingosine reductase, Tsc10 [Aaosphaeria arxii CBS 175.79]|uniref:3-dehydrosphinganine reductase n=1 Tax=Aaosphaeria arxii CBS 175.79 TaxID=1450172 RepID=A0A6A5Y3E9_9PLEO|nr:3-ketodihydrosphingosine reductase, Tsc10 [Aaosphaeria arxii CBS 175.79]KAF2019084.1 3-ketodihydrosphingosine reductase, Tsc10 [Aaosphaeria arxii CBS 175.79]
MAFILWGTIALLLLVAYISLDVMGFLPKRNKFQIEGQTVILTGGSYGMGREVARLISERGANLILVARDPKKLESALEYAKSHAKNPSTQRFHYISADVTSDAENGRILEEATAWNNGRVPEVVWTNAGASVPELFLEQSHETMHKQMDLNYWAHVYLARRTLKAWLYPDTPYQPKEKGAKPEPPRHFIFSLSVIAFYQVAGYGQYAASKSALRATADMLRQEVLLYNGARRSNTQTKQVPAPFDVHIRTVYPATINSPGFAVENETKHPATLAIEETDPVQTEIEAAQGAIRGLEAGNYMTPTSLLADAIRMSTLGGQPRDNIIKDTIGSWITSIVWLFMGPDLDGKVWNWGKKEGMPELKPSTKK